MTEHSVVDLAALANSNGIKKTVQDLEHLHITGREYVNIVTGFLLEWITELKFLNYIEDGVAYMQQIEKFNIVVISFLVLGLIIIVCKRKRNIDGHYSEKETEFTEDGMEEIEFPDETGDNQHSNLQTPRYTHYPYSWNVFDLAKTAYEPGHCASVMDIVDRLHYDVNSRIPSNGLTLFLCACLSGQADLIRFMLKRGADVKCTTKAGDTALYLATFGILGSPVPDLNVLKDIIQAGCNVNAANLAGYTALHRAASHGNVEVIQMLLRHGADRYQASASGIYPIDNAINTGNLEAARLLELDMPNPHAWDIIDPHTPPHIKLGLQSPQRKHLVESTRRIMSPGIMSPRVM